MKNSQRKQKAQPAPDVCVLIPWDWYSAYFGKPLCIGVASLAFLAWDYYTTFARVCKLSILTIFKLKFRWNEYQGEKRYNLSE